MKFITRLRQIKNCILTKITELQNQWKSDSREVHQLPVSFSTEHANNEPNWECQVFMFVNPLIPANKKGAHQKSLEYPRVREYHLKSLVRVLILCVRHDIFISSVEESNQQILDEKVRKLGENRKTRILFVFVQQICQRFQKEFCCKIHWNFLRMFSRIP